MTKAVTHSSLLGMGLLNFGEYQARLRTAVSPQAITDSTLIKSTRYPGEFRGTTIITDPHDQKHEEIYKSLFHETKLLVADIPGLSATPMSSYHATLHGLIDPDVVSAATKEQLTSLLEEVKSFIDGHQGKWRPINFRLAGYFLRIDALVMGLMPASEQDYEEINQLRLDLVNGKVFQSLKIGVGRPEIFHITTAYLIGGIGQDEKEVVQRRIIASNQSALPQEPYSITNWLLTEFADLNTFPRIPGVRDLQAK